MGNETEFLANHDILATSLAPDAGLRARETKVIEAMAAVCAERSFAATTISEVVRRAGISSRTFYKLFESKRACFEAAIAAFVTELEAAVAAARAETDSWTEEVRAAITAILELSAAKPDFAKLAFVESGAVDPALVEHYRLALAAALQYRPAPEGETPEFNAAALAAFGQAQMLIVDQITSGRGAQLPELLPDLLFVALLPFVGHEEALRAVQLA
jgi:AcrR family transcriptional regulator